MPELRPDPTGMAAASFRQPAMWIVLCNVSGSQAASTSGAERGEGLQLASEAEDLAFHDGWS